MATGFSASILFDWALPLLTDTTSPDVGSQFWSLLALREGLANMELDVIRRWAAALFAMCEQLLDAEDTPPHLLQPLLAIVVQVKALCHFLDWMWNLGISQEPVQTFHDHVANLMLEKLMVASKIF